MIKKLKIEDSSENQRLDKFLKRQFSTLNQSFIEKNLRKKNILVNNQKVKSKYLVKKSDEIKIKKFFNWIIFKFWKEKKYHTD